MNQTVWMSWKWLSRTIVCMWKCHRYEVFEFSCQIKSIPQILNFTRQYLSICYTLHFLRHTVFCSGSTFSLCFWNWLYVLGDQTLYFKIGLSSNVFFPKHFVNIVYPWLPFMHCSILCSPSQYFAFFLFLFNCILSWFSFSFFPLCLTHSSWSLNSTT